MGEAGRLIKNTGIIAVGGMATKFVQFLLLPLYTSILSTEEYGIVDYINTIAIFLVPVVSLLMDEALFRYLIDCKTEDDRRKAVTCSCLAMLIGCCVFGIGALVFWLIFRPGNLLWVVGLVVAQTALQMTSAVLRGFGKTAAYAFMSFLASLATIVLNVIFIAFMRWGVVGMLSATILGQGGIALLFVVREQLWNYLDVSALSIPYVGSLVRYSIPLIPNKVSWTIMNMIGRLITMNFIGASAAGVYAVSYKFPGALDTICGFFYMAWKESSARALNSESDEVAFYNVVHRALRRFIAATVLMLTAFMPLIYSILVEDSYEEGMLYVPILLVSTYYSNISGFYGGIFTAQKDTRVMGTTTMVSAAICLVLSIILIPTIGLWGAAISSLVATFTVNEYRLAKVQRYARLDKDIVGRILAVSSLILVLSLYYGYYYSNNPLCLVFCIVAALGYSVPSNWKIVKKIIYKAFNKENYRA